MRALPLASCLALLLVACAREASSESHRTTEPTMHEYAFVFRAHPALSPDQLASRNAAARAWALARRDEGVLRFAAPLEPEGASITAEGTAAIAPELAAILVIAAADLETALALARQHPGLAYGTTIEVRPVRAVTPR